MLSLYVLVNATPINQVHLIFMIFYGIFLNLVCRYDAKVTLLSYLILFDLESLKISLNVSICFCL